MRRESIKYLGDIPISVRVLEVKNYPLHWNKAVSIIWALEGDLLLKVENESYRVREREVEVVNSDEVFEVQSVGESAKILILEFDLNYFSRYYKDANDMFFYTNLPGDDIEDERYQTMKLIISKIVFEYIYKLDDHEDQIEDGLINLFYHLVNNFHYLFSEEESLKDDEELLNRYHRIVKNMSNNYMDKISLSDIAKDEYLSTQYLSTKIKEIFGKSFNEYLNMIRAEEATKLLLDSDYNISEISVEVGFSHIRYFNKHFKLNYGMTPMEYRKKYRLTPKEFEEQKLISELELVEAVPYIHPYLAEYERYEYDNKIYRLDLDLGGEVIGEFKRPDLLDLGDISLLLEADNIESLKSIQKNIGFKYGYVRNIFSSEMDIYRGKNNLFINWNRVENVLDLLLNLRLEPIINSKNVPKYIIEEFENYFFALYGEDRVLNWLDTEVEDFSTNFVYGNVDDKYDTLEGALEIINSYVNEGIRISPTPIDEIFKETYLENDTFFGGCGLYTSNLIQKASYFSFQFLSKLGSDVLSFGDDHILTKTESGYALLLYNYSSKEDIKRLRKYSINFYNLSQKSQITKFELSKTYGSSFDSWLSLGSPVRLSNNHWELLRRYTYPQVSLHFGNKATVYNLVSQVKENGAILFILELDDSVI